MGTRRALTVACVVFFAATAFAAQRGTSQGDWRTGDFSAPDLVGRWGHGDTNGAHNVISLDDKQTRNDKPTIKLDTNAGFDNWVYFPNTKDLDIDLTQAKAMKGYLRSENKNGWGGDPWIIFIDMSGKKARFDGTRKRLFDATKGWAEVVVPVGTDLDAKCTEYGWKPKIAADFDWKHVSCVQIHQDTDGHGYIMWYSGFEFLADKPLQWWLSSLDQPDISLGYAEQVPQYRRNFASEPDKKFNIPELVGKEATEKHWPDAGEKIKYAVHIKNAGHAKSTETDFVCTIDDQPALTAKIPALDPKQETTIEVPWTWKQGPFLFVAKADTENKTCEITKKNNTLEFKTDAYALVAVCEKTIVEPVEQVNNWYGSFCFEDFMRGATVDQLNRLFQRSRYDFAPNGAEVSVRLGKIILVDKLRDSKGEPVDKTLDLSGFDGTWHYDMSAIDEYRDLANDFDWALVHELSHQLGVIDDYQYDMGPKLNLINHEHYDRGVGGIMGGGQICNNEYPAYADVDVAGLNLTKGHRRGFYGEYLYCMPLQNTLVVSLNGKPLANQAIEIFQKDMHTGKIDKPAVFSGKTNEKGEFPLANREVPKNFTTATGCSLHPNPFGYPDVVGRNGLFLIRAEIDGKWYFRFIDIGRFVVEYARGHKDAASYPVELLPESPKPEKPAAPPTVP